MVNYIYIYIFVVCPVALKVKMSDRAWMYTGHTGQNKWSAEWFTKTKGFVQAAFANGQKKTWCPCFRCGNWEKKTEAEMGKHLQKSGFRPIIRCGHFMVSLPNVTELRWIIVAPTSMVPGWKTWWIQP